MREWTRQCRLEEAFRQELFRLLNQYLSSPDDATLGTIVRTLVNYQHVWAAVEEVCQRTCVTVVPGASIGQWNDSGVSNRKTTARAGRLVSRNLPKAEKTPVLEVNSGRNRSASDER